MNFYINLYRLIRIYIALSTIEDNPFISGDLPKLSCQIKLSFGDNALGNIQLRLSQPQLLSMNLRVSSFTRDSC